MPERRWKQVIKDTAEKERLRLLGQIPKHILESPLWPEWQKKYSLKKILEMIEDQKLPWEKEMEQIAVADPMERLGTRFTEVLEEKSDAA